MQSSLRAAALWFMAQSIWASARTLQGAFSVVAPKVKPAKGPLAPKLMLPWHALPVRPGAEAEGACPFQFQPLPLLGGSLLPLPPLLMLLLTAAPPTFVTVVLPIDVAVLLVEDIDIDEDDDEATPIALALPPAKVGAASTASDIPYVLSLI